MSDEKSVKTSFYEKYNIKVVNNHKRFYKSCPARFFNDSLDKNIYEQDLSIDVLTEPLLTVEIPESKLNDLMKLEAFFYNNIDNIHSRRMFELWYEQQLEEKELRTKYPACQSAYENYSTILTLCRKNPKKIKDL